MYKFLFSFLFTVISAFCLAQQASFEAGRSTSSVLLQKVVPPSPTAASIGKYGDQTIGMFTGTSAVQIPIYQLKGAISLPISLSYSSSGLKVTEAASQVGLGWTLNAGGVVTRVVKGLPDGVHFPLNIRTWPVPLVYTQPNEASYNYIHAQIQLGLMDPEPDIYIIRAGNLNLKFYYDLHNRIQTIPYDNEIKISYDGGLDQYKVIANDGTTYLFGGGQSSEITYSSNPSYAAYTSSWFVTKITNIRGDEVVFNNVKGTVFVTQDQYSESEEVKELGQSGHCAYLNPSGRTTNWSAQTFLPVFLSSIETETEEIVFVRNTTQRQDMPGDYQLDEINVMSKATGSYDLNFEFSYSYFPQVSTICWGNGVSPAHQHDLTAICKRLRLDQFKEKGAAGNTTGFKIHQFQYSTKPVPSRCSRDQDFWGYYNGANNTSMLPYVTDPNFQASTFNAISRESNHAVADAGMLLKIIYPTGGESNFEYEANEVNSISSDPGFQTANVTLAGTSTALQATANFTISTAQPFVLNFSLTDNILPDQGLQRKIEILDQSGVVLFSAYNFDSHVNGFFVRTNQSTYGNDFQPGTYTLKISRNYLYSSYPNVAPVGLTASVTYYPTTAVVVTNRKVGGYRIKKTFDKTDPTGSEINVKEYKYENPYLIADIRNVDCISSYTRWGVVAPINVVTYECNFKSRTTTSVQPVGTIQGSHIAYGKVTCLYGANGVNGKSEYEYTVDSDIGGYSLGNYYRPITSYDFKRGRLLKQTDYDNAGQVRKILANIYNDTTLHPGIYTSAYYIRDEPITILINYTLFPLKVIAFKDFAIPSQWLRTKSSSETIYGAGNYITKTQTNYYDNTNYSFATKTEVTNSKGDIISETMKYPLDYKPVSTKSNEQLEREFEVNYQTLFNNFVSSNSAASGTSAIEASYTTYQNAYDNLKTNRNTALINYKNTFITLANSTSDPVLKAQYLLIANNQLSELLEKRTLKNGITELSKTVNEFKNNNGLVLLDKVRQSYSGNALEDEVTVDVYDAKGNILQATPKDGVKQSFLWDYNGQLPIAKVVNADVVNVAYSSFESDGKGGWTFSGTPVTDISSPSGTKAYNLTTGAISKSVQSGTVYTLSYWRPVSQSALTIAGTMVNYPVSGRVVNGWKYYEHRITGQTTITVSGSNVIDELRLYPVQAMMSTYVYDQVKGMTAQVDAQNKIVYYEYDSYNRLMLMRDQDKNIIKKICYNYAGQVEECGTWVNTVKSGPFQKSNCSSCQIGATVTYTVPAGSYTSSISQTDADQKAQNDVDVNGPTYANLNGSCQAPVLTTLTGTNAITTKSFIVVFFNNCTGVSYNYTLNPSTMNVALSPQLPTGNYNVSFAPTGGAGTYLYIVNGFSHYANIGSISNVNIISGSNQVRVQP